MKIQITDEIKQEIAQGITKAQRMIEKENGYGDLKKEEAIERNENYINQMNEYLEQGYITA